VEAMRLQINKYGQLVGPALSMLVGALFVVHGFFTNGLTVPALEAGNGLPKK
jgi:hypothetical protein